MRWEATASHSRRPSLLSEESTNAVGQNLVSGLRHMKIVDQEDCVTVVRLREIHDPRALRLLDESAGYRIDG